MSPGGEVNYLNPVAQWTAVMTGTARAVIKRYSAYMIDVIRWPLGMLLYFLTLRLTYQVSGLEEIGGANVAGFLLVGMIGVEAWSSTIWSSGYAIEHERHEGTVGALFLSPASRVAVVLGYGLGSFVWSLPALAMLGVIAVATGADFAVSEPFAPLASMTILYLSSLCVGFAFAGLFVLSRRGNVLANFLQLPIYLLAGLVVPRSELPSWLHPLSGAIPVSHAIDALRDATLEAATIGDVWTTLLAALAGCAGFALVGAISLSRVEHAAKRAGSLELY